MSLARVRAAYEKFLEAVVILLMALLAGEVTLGVVFRYTGYSLVWYDEVASILLAWLTFYGSALAAAKRAHIGCPEVVQMLPARARFWLRIIAEALVLAFFVLITWVGYSILDVLATDYLTSLPEVSSAYAQSVIPISGALIILSELMTLPATLAEARAGVPRAGMEGAQ